VHAVRRTAPWLFALSLLVALFPVRADAACNKPDILASFPPDGATAVPTNAMLTAHYSPNAAYLGEEVTLEEVGVGEETVDAKWNEAELLLTVTPTLKPGADYVIHWPRLRGTNTASLGRGMDAEFSVGAQADSEPPVFAGLSGIDYDVDRERDDCTDRLEERYRFDFDLGPASDDGGRESLMLKVFQTRGPNLHAGQPVPVLIGRIPREGTTARLSTPIDDGVGEVCFAALVSDLTGKASASANREVCIETVEPPYFAGCAIGGRAPSGALAAFLGLALFFRLRRGRRR
jgi:hypothetical protein